MYSVTRSVIIQKVQLPRRVHKTLLKLKDLKLHFCAPLKFKIIIIIIIIIIIKNDAGRLP